MKLTLRKANALQTSIQDYIKSVKLVDQISINEFQDATVEITMAREAFNSSRLTVRDLTRVMYDIRAKIGRANVESGVSDLLTQAAYVDKQLASLATLVTKDVTEAQDVITGKLAKLKAQSAETTRYYGHDQTIGASVIDDEMMVDLKGQQAALKKEKQALNDKVLELNIRTEITLSDDVAELLKAHQLL